MKNIVAKLWLVFVPYLLSILGLLVTYSLLHWLFVVRLDWVSIDSGIIEFFLPILGTVAVFFWKIHPRIKKLYFKNEKTRDFFYFIGIISFAIPIIISQIYLSSATGKLTVLKNIKAIDSLPKTKYYQLEQYHLYKEAVGIHTDISTSGKQNQYLNFKVFCVQPITVQIKDTINDETHYWFCTKYYKEISNRKSDDEKKAAFEAFMLDCQKKFYSDRFYFNYLERIAYSKDAENYGHAASKSELARDGQDILLIPRQGKYESRTGGTFGWILKSLGIGSLLFICMLFFARLKTASELNNDKKRSIRAKARGWQKNNEFFIPRKNYFLTPILIYSNIIIYLLLYFSGAGFFQIDYHSLHDFGGVTRWAVKSGELWRLFTAVFLHGNLIHITNNMLSLFFVGIFLEPVLGKWRFLIIYLICGLSGSIASILWHERTLSVGASAAIFGMYGLMLALVIMKVFEKSVNKLFLALASIFVGINLFMGFTNNSTDNAAHLGGLVCGFFIGFLLCNTIQEEIKDIRQ